MRCPRGKGVSARNSKGQRENYFSSPTVSDHPDGTCWDTLLTLEPEDGILRKLVEADKGQEFLPKSAFWISVVLGRERDLKSHIVSSFPNSDSCEFSFGVPIDYQFFPSQGLRLPSSCLVSWLSSH